MTITITAFERSPDGGKGLSRDTRVRWALEEVGRPYQVRHVSFRAMKEPAHLALHPFGQITSQRDTGAYVARGEARPAYKRAFEAQLADYTGKTSTVRAPVSPGHARPRHDMNVGLSCLRADMAGCKGVKIRFRSWSAPC